MVRGVWKILWVLGAACVLLWSCGESGGSVSALVEGQEDAGQEVPEDATDEMDVASEEPADDPEPDPQPEQEMSECVSNADCDDGIFCNGAERCSEGVCFASPRPPCVDDIDCTVDRCDDDNRQCVFVADDSLCAEGEVCDLKAGCFAPRECVRDEDCDDGLLCNGQESCEGESCQPGEPVACDDGVACTDDACDEEVGGCQSVPDHTFCLPTEFCNILEDCTPRPPCASDDDCDDGSFCNGQEVCDQGTGECVPGQLPELDDGLDCTIDTCSEELSMVVHTASNLRCSDGLFCNGAEVCHPAEGCQTGEAPVLSDGLGCTTDTCNEALDFIEHLPNHEACSDGLFCNGDEVCHPVEGCAPGEPREVSDGVGCTIDTCSEIDDAIVHVPSNESCDDGLFCNGDEVCDPELDCQAGSPPEVDDGVACTRDVCDEDRDRIVHNPDDGVCDDGLFCNGDEVCDPVVEGADGRGCSPGAAPGVDDGIACTGDACDEDLDRVVHVPDDGACDDGLFCNGDEVCDVQAGCQAGALPSLNDDVGCTTDTCDEANDRVVHTPNDGACSDGLFCNGTETCDVDNGCQQGSPPSLEDGVPCTDGVCDEANDRVVHTPNNGSCSDGLFCNGAEICDLARGCLPGVAPGLGDGVGCTTDTCDEDLDRVVHTPDNGACNDGLFCNGIEICHPLEDCRAGAPPVLSDGVGCTTDTCDEANDRVVHTPNNSVCNDGLFCNGVEVCDVDNGCEAGQAINVNDGVGCTIDTCDEVNNRVVHTPNDSVCSDNLFCNGAEVCDVNNGCQAGVPPSLDDGVGCTGDACDEANDRILHSPNHGSCSDGLFCNGVEVCDVNNGCQSGTPPPLGDGVGCTTDTCDEVNNRIVHTPNDGVCSDNLFCNGAEVCDVNNGCQQGTPPTLGDGVGCTTDTCDEANDRVVHTPDDGACSDSLFCNGVEVCDVDNDCQQGSPPSLEDGIPCTDGVCDEASDRIVQNPIDSRCDNNEVCDGAEACQVGVGCIDGAAPDEGFVCQSDPRLICLNEKCEPSACSDGFVDIGAGEQCDDANLINGDGCDASCQNEVPDPFDYNGTYGILPDASYTCSPFGITVIDYSFTSFIFSINNNTLTVAARPRGIPDVVMSQTPAPTDGTFDVSVTVFGTCDETYRLTGSFTNDDQWIGSFSRTLSGFCFECTNAVIDPMRGSRNP